jgi:AcrR family transcriptional regulator
LDVERAQQPARKRRTNYRKDGYHHGNLDAALLEIATRLIDEEGVGAVTLRRVAEKAGVTATAAQHHYGDKEGLLRAIASVSFKDLLSILTTASKYSEDPESNLRSVVGAYARFAVANPERFRFMFEAGYLDPILSPVSANLGLGCFDVLRLTVDRYLGRHVVAAPLFVWSMGHGVGSILSISRIPSTDRPGRTNDEIIDEMVNVTIDGLRQFQTGSGDMPLPHD